MAQGTCDIGHKFAGVILTDGVHLVSDHSICDLHDFAWSMGLKRCWYRGVRKGHPHYDLTTPKKLEAAIAAGARLVTTRELLRRMAKR